MSEPVQPRARDRALRIGVVVVLAVLPLVVRVAWEASAEMSAAAAAREAGDEETEIIHLGRALRWRLPLASHDEHAITRLLQIGETTDDPARALVAYREIRSGLLGSRALDLPHADTLRDVDARIATIMAAGDAEVETVRLAELRVASQDSRVGKAVAALAWIAWVVASARFLMHGIDARGRLVPGVGTRSGLLALALLIGWMIAWRLA